MGAISSSTKCCLGISVQPSFAAYCSSQKNILIHYAVLNGKTVFLAEGVGGSEKT